ncbi:MAG: LPS assembly lipoprotein LptE [Porticoccaceae bacterium]|nr:LPS assembly lipoprotein LptE [Porticoccaceae bacterium]
MLQKIALIGLVLILAACGWQLRDAQVVPENVGKIHLLSQQPNEQLLAELSLALKVYGVDVVNRNAQPDYSVVITDYRRVRRTSSMNSGARVAEYQLNEEVDFIILNSAGDSLSESATAAVERVYEFTESDVLASSDEERTVRSDMRIEIVRQVINRLRVLPKAQ